MQYFLSFTSFDLSFLSLIAVSVLFGLIRGFIKSSISLLGWLISAFVAVNFSSHLVPFVMKYNFSESISEVLAIIATFVCTAIIIALLNSILVSIIKCICGGVIDRSTGAALGLARGCAIASVVFYMLTLLVPSLYISGPEITKAQNDKLPGWAKNSKSVAMLSRGADIIASFLPNNFRHELNESIKDSVQENEHHIASSNAKSEHVKSVKQVLASLPPEVVDDVSADDLITVQDVSANSNAKTRIMTNISNKYHDFAVKNNIADSSRYTSLMKSIEDLIAQYNEAVVTQTEAKQ